MEERTREVNQMNVTKDVLVGILEALVIITEKSKDTKEVKEAIVRIQGKIKEPNAKEVASQSR